MGIQIKPQNPTHNQSNFKINLNAQLKSRLGKKKKKGSCNLDQIGKRQPCKILVLIRHVEYARIDVKAEV